LIFSSSESFVGSLSGGVDHWVARGTGANLPCVVRVDVGSPVPVII